MVSVAAGLPKRPRPATGLRGDADADRLDVPIPRSIFGFTDKKEHRLSVDANHQRILDLLAAQGLNRLGDLVALAPPRVALTRPARTDGTTRTADSCSHRDHARALRRRCSGHQRLLHQGPLPRGIESAASPLGLRGQHYGFRLQDQASARKAGGRQSAPRHLRSFRSHRVVSTRGRPDGYCSAHAAVALQVRSRRRPADGLVRRQPLADEPRARARRCSARVRWSAARIDPGLGRPRRICARRR